MSNVVVLGDTQNQAYRTVIEQRRGLVDSDPVQLLTVALLVRVVRGEVDLNKVAIVELAQRGMDQDGQWVGFDKAHQIARDAMTGLNEVTRV